MKPNHAITPEIYKQILTLAKTLPPIVRIKDNGKKMVRAAGSKLGKEMTEEDKLPYKGVKILQNARYTLWEPVCLNHGTELVKRYQIKGQAGIEEYVKAVKKVVRTAKAKKKKNESN